MTKSYLINDKRKKIITKSWEQNIIARRFTISTISKQLIYNMQVYFRENESLKHIAFFSFLCFIQLLFYTLGAFITKSQHGKMLSLKK